MFKVLVSGCDPTRGSKYSACVDLYASEDVVIGAGETKLVGVGVCIDLSKLRMARYEETAFTIKRNVESHNLRFPHEWTQFLNSHYLQLMLRSSLGKEGLILANGVGVIDLDYKDEIKMLIHRPFKGSGLATFTCEIKKGDKIGQITLLEHKSYLFGVESDVVRDGGFGSTGE